MAQQMHLHSTGNGMAAKTAYGRNILRTPLSTSYEEFSKEKNRCTDRSISGTVLTPGTFPSHHL